VVSRRYAAINGWRWVGWYLRRGRVVAALRQAWGAYVEGDDRARCQDCGQGYPAWRASDHLFGLVTGRWRRQDGESASGVFCPGCFDRMAVAKGIDNVWFVATTRPLTHVIEEEPR
jgi:hypothetical protein